MKRNVGGRSALTLASFSVLAGGCLNPNSYSTPRTTPAGEVQHSVSIEYVSYRNVRPVAERQPSEVEAGNTLVAPSYGLRIGLAERLDLGLRLANSSALGADVKWNFFRTDLFDIAAAPGARAQYAFAGSGSDVHVFTNLPVLFGINPSEEVSIVPSTGLAYGIDTSDSSYNNAFERVAGTEALFLQAGIGIDFRSSSSFAIHPEMSLLKRVTGRGEADMIWYTFGVGFNWGALPSYGTGR